MYFIVYVRVHVYVLVHVLVRVCVRVCRSMSVFERACVRLSVFVC